MLNPVSFTRAETPARHQPPQLISDRNRASQGQRLSQPATSAGRGAQSELTSSSDESSMGLNESIQANKEQNLAYQLMRAMARTQQNDNHFYDDEQLKQDWLGFTSQEFEFSLQQSQWTSLSGAANEFSFQVDQLREYRIEISQNQSTGQFTFSMSFTELQIIQFNSGQPQASKQVDPLIVNLSGGDFGFDLSQQVEFDLDADGQLDQFSNLQTGSYWLALDKNQNQTIDNGLELFGDSGGAVDGFADLARYDDDANWVINSDDAIFSQLVLMSFDSAGNQQTQSLQDAGIVEISLKTQAQIATYQDNNQLLMTSELKTENGDIALVGDFLLTAR